MKRCGTELDPWQADVLDDWMGLDEKKAWSAFECGINSPRQNGKDEVLQARALWGLFEGDDRLVLWSSQNQDTSSEALYRMVSLIDANEELSRRVKRVYYANGKESIWLTDGRRVMFMTRSKARAKGFSGDLVIFNEAMFLAEFSVAAMLPTLSARLNPQVIYAGTAVDQMIHDQGVMWSSVRERALEQAPRLAYTEFSVEADSPAALTREQLEDPSLWEQANPALGKRISADYVAAELNALDDRSFAVERLGVGDWPRTDMVGQSVIDMAVWAQLGDPGSVMADPVWFAFDVSPDRTAAVAAAGIRGDGRWHVEVIASKTGTAWLPGWLAAKVEQHQPAAVVCDAVGPVASVLAAVTEAGVSVRTVTAQEHAGACGRLVDLVNEDQLRHLEQPSLTAAVRGASVRPLNDAWLWSRKASNIDISPLVAATLALDAGLSDFAGGDTTIY